MGKGNMQEYRVKISIQASNENPNSKPIELATHFARVRLRDSQNLYDYVCDIPEVKQGNWVKVIFEDKMVDAKVMELFDECMSKMPYPAERYLRVQTICQEPNYWDFYTVLKHEGKRRLFRDIRGDVFFYFDLENGYRPTGDISIYRFRDSMSRGYDPYTQAFVGAKRWYNPDLPISLPSVVTEYDIASGFIEDGSMDVETFRNLKSMGFANPYSPTEAELIDLYEFMFGPYIETK